MIDKILRGFGYVIGTVLGLLFMMLLLASMALVWVCGGPFKITKGNTELVYRWFTLVKVTKKEPKK